MNQEEFLKKQYETLNNIARNQNRFYGYYFLPNFKKTLQNVYLQGAISRSQYSNLIRRANIVMKMKRAPITRNPGLKNKLKIVQQKLRGLGKMKNIVQYSGNDPNTIVKHLNNAYMFFKNINKSGVENFNNADNIRATKVLASTLGPLHKQTKGTCWFYSLLNPMIGSTRCFQIINEELYNFTPITNSCPRKNSAIPLGYIKGAMVSRKNNNTLIKNVFKLRTNNVEGGNSSIANDDLVKFYNTLFKGHWKYLNTRGNIAYEGRNVADPLIILQKMAPNKEIPRRLKNYTLSHCHIFFKQHGICGFVNNGKYYIYDSNKDHAYVYDWTEPKVYKALAKYYFEEYNSKIQINIVACYIRDRGRVQLQNILNNPLLMPRNYVKRQEFKKITNNERMSLKRRLAGLFTNKNKNMSYARIGLLGAKKPKNALAPLSPNARNHRN